VGDSLALANQLTGALRFECSLVSVNGRTVRSSGVSIKPASASDKPDLLVVPGMRASSSPDLISRIARLEAEQGHIASVRRRGARIATICVGAFLAAAAGVLKNRRVTTAWALADGLARWRADLSVDADAMVLRDGPILSTGAMTAAYDLALELVCETDGADAALRLAKLLAHDARRQSQQPFQHQDPTLKQGAQQTDPLIERAERHLAATLADGYALPALARHCGSSPRNLLRRFKAATGETPLQYRHRLVVETVKSLLEATTLPLAQIPERLGYRDEVALRRLFKAHTTMTFKDYRRRFGALPAHRNVNTGA
jgi:transcriptional regulator GlxA family with amidase domain